MFTLETSDSIRDLIIWKTFLNCLFERYWKLQFADLLIYFYTFLTDNIDLKFYVVEVHLIIFTSYLFSRYHVRSLFETTSSLTLLWRLGKNIFDFSFYVFNFFQKTFLNLIVTYVHKLVSRFKTNDILTRIIKKCVFNRSWKKSRAHIKIFFGYYFK